MSDIAIRVENLSKQYRIGGPQAGYKTLRESLTEAVAAPFRRLSSVVRGQSSAVANETIWALKDVSFEVQRGEVVGIIGRNGAGKTTLLKILSRITEPTEGHAEIHGRVGSLLEVGTGFHPELTGRENIYLNGAILGMRRAEIDRKFDEIVAFAEIEKFIDTPVKHYSSGMGVRLAFAVAAHLEPKILLVDEVLAVGDVQFQKKCLGKMEDVSKQGRTVMFVSHNMQAITRLCERIILLDEGRLVEDGPSYRVVGRYLRSGLGTQAAREWPDISKAPGNEVVRLRAVRVYAGDGRVSEIVDVRQPVAIEIEYDVLEVGVDLSPAFHFINEDGVTAFVSIDLDQEWSQRPRPVGRFVSMVQIPGNFLAEGTMTVGVSMATYRPLLRKHFFERDAVAFHVVDNLEGNSARGNFGGNIVGVVRPLLSWKTQFKDSGD